MSDLEETANIEPQDQPQPESPIEVEALPPQTSPEDTSNWENRPLTTPSERMVIETYESKDSDSQVPEK